GGARGGRASRRHPRGRADRDRGGGALLGVVRRVGGRARAAGVPRPHGGGAGGGARAHAAPPPALEPRGSRPDRVLQPSAAQQIPPSTHRRFEGGRACRAGVRVARRPEAAVRFGATGWDIGSWSREGRGTSAASLWSSSSPEATCPSCWTT